MATFPLEIVTPDGQIFQGEAERICCRTIEGDVALLANHCDYCTAIGMGSAHVIVNGETRYAACMGGMLSMLDGKARVMATTWEWADEIDKARAEASKARAERLLADEKLDKRQQELAEARLKRALVRTSVAR